jgi:hypothetical protein
MLTSCTRSAIRHPLSGGKEFREVSLYKAYADTARQNLKDGNFFEAILVCSVGLDVLLNALPDRLLLFSSSKLDDCQKRILQNIEKRELTAGRILKQLELACVLDNRLLRAMKALNAERNKIFHPVQKKQLKQGAILPSLATKSDASKFYRKFCHVIDVAGGKSPHSEKRDLNQYAAERNRKLKKTVSKN